MDTVIRMIYRAIGPMIVTGAIALALILQNSVSRSNTAVQNLLEDTYSLSATESSRGVEEILYTPDDIKSLLYTTDNVNVSIEVHSQVKNYRFTRTLGSFIVEEGSAVGDSNYHTIFSGASSDTVPDSVIADAFTKLTPGHYAAKYEYSETNGRTNILFIFKGAE